MTESAATLEECNWDAFIIYGIFCARWQGMLLFPAAPYMINLDVKLLTPGLQLWLDATDPLANGSLLINGTPISTWYDKSGNLNNATGGVSPFYANNSIVFTGASFLDTTLTARPIYETIFVVFILASQVAGSFTMVGSNSQAGRGLRVFNNNLGYNVAGANGYSNTNGGILKEKTTLASGTILAGPDNGVGTTFINGGTHISQSQIFTTYGEGTTRIGSGNGTDFFNGTICEVLIYNRSLSMIERQRVEGYLAWKWRINGSLPTTHNYYTSFDVVVKEIAALSNLPGFIIYTGQTNTTTTEFTINWTGGNNTTYYRYVVNGSDVLPLNDQGVLSGYARIGGLTAGNVYSIVIIAYNSAGSRLSATFLAGTAPPKPFPFQTSASLSEITINWPFVQGATSYRYSLNGISTIPAGSNSNTAIFVGLEAGTLYTVILTAVNVYASTSSDPLIATTYQTKPVSLNISNGLTNGFTLNWIASKGATSYTYTFNGLVTIPVSQTSNSATFTGLSPGISYVIIVIANNSLIPFFSNESAPFTATTAPSQPVSLVASNILSNRFDLSWTGGIGATRYTYTIDGFPVLPVVDQSLTNQYVAFSGLSEGTSRVVIVNAVNISGSTSSDPLIIRTPPGVPINLFITNTNSSGFRVNWSGGIGATSYSYQLNGRIVTASNDRGLTDNYAVFTGLEVGTTYNVTVIASNLGGFSMSSSIISLLTGLQLWLDSANPLGTGILPVNDSVLALWYDLSTNKKNATGVNSPIYTTSGIKFNGSSQYYTTAYTSSPVTESIFIVYKLNSSGTMALVDTSNNGGRSFQSYLSNGPSLARSPATWLLYGLYPVSTDTTYIGECLYNSSGISIYMNGNVSSSNSTNPGFSTGTTYIGAGNGNYPSISWYLNGTISEVIIFNSVLSTPDRQKVEGYLAWKWGLEATLPVSHPYYNTTPTGPTFTTTSPSQPTSLTLTNASETGFRINWTGGNGATFYRYTLNGATLVPSIDLGLTNKSITLTGLTGGTSYQIVIIASNSSGSTSSSSFTAITTPSKPISLTVSNIKVDGFKVTWLGGDSATSYIYTLNGNLTTPSVNQGLVNKSATFSGLTPHTIYIVIITAINSSGPSSSGIEVNPITIPGIQAWLDATDPLNTGAPGENGAPLVTYWYDKSGKGNNMLFTGSSVTYANNSVNSLNTIFANGSTGAVLLIPVNTFTANYCGFIVFRNTDSTKVPDTFFDRRSNGQGVPLFFDSADSYRVGNVSLGNPTEPLTRSVGTSLVEVLLTTYAPTGGTGNFKSYINGSPISFSGGTVTGLNAEDVAQNQISFSGPNLQARNIVTNYCEIIMYNSNISNGDRQKIEGYLAWKWGLQNKPLYFPSTYFYLTTNAIDMGGNPQGVTNNNVVFGRNNFKASAKFNNSTGTYLSVPFPYATGSFTISYWFNVTDNQYYNPWSLSGSATGTGSYGINSDLTDGRQSASLAFSGGILSIPLFTYPNTAMTWYHFALTVNLTTGLCKLYGNGVLKTSATGSGTLTNSAYLIIGKAGDNSRVFNGAINNFAVYNSALSSSQISDIYSSQVVTNSLPPTHPYYSTPPISGLKLSTLPVTPSSFSLSEVVANGFTLNWAVGGNAYDYTFTLNTVSTEPTLLSPNSATFSGLLPGTFYSVIVTAINTEGGAVDSHPYTAGTAPSKPNSLVISNVTSSGFQVNWVGGTGATSYTYSLNDSPAIPSNDQGLASKYAVFSGLTGNTLYTVFIRAINPLGSSLSSTSISPLTIPGLQLWLDGNDPFNIETAGTNNASLATWYDKSGNSRNMVWTGSSIRYENSSINSLNTILVDGIVQGTVSIPIGTFSSNYCGFIVLKTTRASGTIFGRTDTNGWGIFDYLNEIHTATAVGNRTLIANNQRAVNGRFIGYPIMMNFGLQNYAATGNTGTYNQYYSGLPVPLSGGQTTGLNVSDTISSDIYFGGRAGISVNHKVNYCEILLFNSNISITERHKLEGYLAWKWGLQSLRPYAAQTVLLLNEYLTDTGLNPQNVTNNGVSIVSLVTNPSEKSSANFTGTNYLSLPFNYGTGSFSITYWTYRATTASMTAWSLSSSDTGSGQAGINATSTNGIQHFYLTFTDGMVDAGNWSTPAGFAVWYQSVLTVDSVTGECKSYLNRVLKNTVTGVGTLQNTGNLLLGRNGTNTQGFNGYLTNFAVYDYVLTQTQIIRIYNSESIVNLLPLSHPYYSTPPISLVSIITLPPKPLTLSLTNVTTTGFTVNWSGTSGVTNFTYTLNGIPSVAVSTTSLSATFTGLTPGTPYTIVVNSVNGVGGSTASDSFAGSTLPSKPTILSSSSISRTGFTISWTGGATVISYTYSLNGVSVVPSNDQGLVSRTATFRELSGGITYAVIVTANNRFGSTPSDSFNVLTSPGLPTSLNATSITSSSFIVNWSGANGATSYTYSIDGIPTVPASSTSTSATFTGLLAGTSYAVIVTAVNTSGSTASASQSMLTLPSVPFNLSQTAGSLNEVTVNWLGGFGATSYAYTLNGTSTTPSDDQGVASKYAIFGGLSPGTTYSIIVIAVNSSGSISSPPTVSNVSGQYLWIDGNDPLGSGTPPANNSTLSTLYDKSGNSRNLSVTNPATPSTFSSNSVNGMGNLLFANSVYRSATFTGTVLFPFDVYVVLKLNSVTAAASICSICQSNSASSYNALTFSSSKWSNASESSVRSPSTLASSTETSTGYILIQWAFGNSNFNIYRNGSQIAYTSSYTYIPPASLSFLLGLAVDTTTTGNFNGAIAEIVAYNTLQGTTNRQYIEGALAWKWGIQSSLSTIHPYYSTRPAGLNVFTAPPAAISFTQTNGSTTGFRINWSGASGATSFSYTLNGINAVPVSTTASSATFTGLTAGTSYAVIVTAFNGPVAKTESDSFSAVTSPSAPNTMVISNLTSSGFTVDWLGGVGATSYSYSLNGSLVTPSIDNGMTSKSATFNDLSPGTTYILIINAINSSGYTEGGNRLTPSNISNLSLWLDGADPNATGIAPALNSSVTSWKDKTTNKNHYTTSGATYSANTDANKNAILFSGSNSGAFQANSSLSLFTDTNRWTIFTAHRGTSSSVILQNIWREKDKLFWVRWYDPYPLTPPGVNIRIGGSNEYTIASTYDGISGINCMVGEGSSSKHSLNGTMSVRLSSDTLISSSRISFASQYSGNTHYDPLYGYMNEILVFNTNLSDLDRQKMEGYLAWKWNTQAKLPLAHPYSSAPPLTPLIIRIHPSIPSSLTSSEITAISFKLSWSGGLGATSYTYSLDSVGTVPSIDQGVESKYAIFTGLSPGTTYAVIVTAISSGDTTPSFSFNVLTRPSAPNSFSYSSVTSTEFTVNWLGGLGATSYIYILNGSPVTPSVDNSQVLKSATFTGLTPATSYNLGINAVNSSGTTAGENLLTASYISGLSLWLDGADPSAIGVAPSLNSTVTSWKDKTTNANHYTTAGATYSYDSVSGKNAILFSGTNSGAFQTNSNLSLFNNTNRWTIITVHRGTNSSVTLQNIWREKDKLFWIRWFNGNANIRVNNEHLIIMTYDQLSGINCLVGEGSTSKYSLNGTANIYASSDSLTSTSRISFASQYSGNTHNDPLYGYMDEVLVFNTNLSDLDRQKMEGYLAWKWNTQTKLPVGHPYSSSAPLTLLTIITSPGIPTALTSSEISIRSFKLSWSGGLGATSYTYSLDGVGTVPSVDQGVESKYAIFTGLSPGITYTVIVTAVFSGLSTPSSSFNVLTRPSAPNSLNTTSVTSSGFTVSWLGGLGATSYIYIINGSPTTPSLDNGVGDKSATFSGLTSATTYDILINAVNSSGTTEGGNQLSSSSIPGLSLWLDGADPNATGVAPSLNSAVTSWKDKTTNSNHYTASGATYSYDSVSGKNAILFSGSNSGAFQTNSSLSFFNDSNRWTIFTLHRGTNSSIILQNIWREKEKLFWIRWYNGNANIRVNNEYLTIMGYDQLSGINCLVGEGSTSKYSLNGTVNVYASSDSLTSTSRISFASQYSGNTHNDPLYGYMDEVLIFNTNLSDLDRERIEGYLAWKWNTQAKLPGPHSYSSGAPLFPLKIVTLS